MHPRAALFLRHAPLPVKLRPPLVWKAWTVAGRCGAVLVNLRRRRASRRIPFGTVRASHMGASERAFLWVGGWVGAFLQTSSVVLDLWVSLVSEMAAS